MSDKYTQNAKRLYEASKKAGLYVNISEDEFVKRMGDPYDKVYQRMIYQGLKSKGKDYITLPEKEDDLFKYIHNQSSAPSAAQQTSQTKPWSAAGSAGGKRQSAVPLAPVKAPAIPTAVEFHKSNQESVPDYTDELRDFNRRLATPATVDIVDQNGKKVDELEIYPLKNQATRELEQARHNVNLDAMPLAQLKKQYAKVTQELDDLEKKAKENLRYSTHLPGLSYLSSWHSKESTPQELETLRATRNKLQSTKKLIEEAIISKQDGDGVGAFFRGVGRGISEKFTDSNTWSAGLKSAIDAGELLAAAEAADKGTATKNQMSLLEAAALEAYFQNKYKDDIGYGYEAGGIAIEAIPFMLEMGISPLSGAGKALAKQMTKTLVKKYGAGVLRKNSGKYIAGKAMTRHAGNVGGAAGMAATSGIPGVAADAKTRETGQIGYKHGDDYSIDYGGRSGGEDKLTAYGKAFAARTIENLSEMLGGWAGLDDVVAASGKAISKNIRKAKLGRQIYDKISNMKSTDVEKVVDEIQWHGTIGEFMEEMYGGAINAVVVGDQTLDTDDQTGLFNQENLIRTALGVGLLGGVISSVRTGAYFLRRDKEQEKITNADTRLRELLGDEWKHIKEQVEATPSEQQAAAIANVLQGKTPEVKSAMMNYYLRHAVQQGLDEAAAKREQEAAEQPGLSGSHHRGSTALRERNEQELTAINDEIDLADMRINTLFSDERERAAVLDAAENGSADDYIATHAELTEEQASAIKNLESALETQTGIESALEEEVQRMSEEYKADRQSKATEQGHLIPIILEDGRHGWLKSGDLSNANGTVYVLMDGSKEAEQIHVSKIAQTGTEESVDEAVARYTEELREQKTAEVRQLMSGQTLTAGKQVQMKLPNGDISTMTITGVQPDNAVTLQDTSGQTVTVDSQSVINWMTAAREDRLEQAAADMAASQPQTTQTPQETISADEALSGTSDATQEEAPTALSTIPVNEEGEPIYESVEPGVAWDALMEQTDGNEEMAASIASQMIADKQAALSAAERQKTRGGRTVAEKIASEKERMARIEQSRKELAAWEAIAGVSAQRKAAAVAEQERAREAAIAARKAKETEEKARREEAEPIDREALTGVPDIIDDTPQAARARGYRRVNGHKVERQGVLSAIEGKAIEVKFSNDAMATGKVAVIEADTLQPSHIGGQRNAKHFIDEAQPKERKDQASVLSAQKIADNIRPEEITTSVTAYTGAPTVNRRGEVIQGNSRSDALKQMWHNNNEQAAKYKQYLIDHAEEFGLRKEDIEKMEHPVLVNMIDVEDDTAISLGQYVAQDTESGGSERIKAKNTLSKMGSDIKSFANILLKTTNEEASFAELLDNNGVDLLKWMRHKGYITDTQYASAFDSKGNLTGEAKNDLRGIMYQSIFAGGSTQLEEMFNAMPAKAQKAILATAFRDYDSPASERMIDDIQDSIRAYYALSHDAAFASAKNYAKARMAIEGWKRQYQMDDVTGESYLPSEKFSNFALLLAAMYKGETQRVIQESFNLCYDHVQGTQKGDMFFTPDNTPKTLAAAVKETYNIDYDGRQREKAVPDMATDGSTAQRQGRDGAVAPGRESETTVRSGQPGADVQGSRPESESEVQESLRGSDEADERRAGVNRTINEERRQEDERVGEEGMASAAPASRARAEDPGSTTANRDTGATKANEAKDNGETKENFKDRLAAAKSETETAPTASQKKAGNYKKGHIRFGGYAFTIETPQGAVRSGVDKVGKAWAVRMPFTYGYILGREGKDGDNLDMFINDAADLDTWDGTVYIVDQVDPETGEFDEHKVMYGFASAEDAIRAYQKSYTPGWQGLGKISGVSKKQFDEWVASSKRKQKPFHKTRYAAEADAVTRLMQETRQRELKMRALDWMKKTGVKVVLVDNIMQVKNKQAKQAIIEGKDVRGWYETDSGEVYIYLPNTRGAQDIDKTIIHEVVAHKGMRSLLGEETYDKLCDQVWDMMSDKDRQYYERYPGVSNIEDTQQRHRAAADEYIAALAESIDLTGTEKSSWQKIVDLFRLALEQLGIKINITDEQLSALIRASYAEMVKRNDGAVGYESGSGKSEKQGVRFSVKDKYLRKREWAARKHAANKEVGMSNGLSEKQADLLERLASLRHELHTSQDSYIHGNSDILKKLVNVNSKLNEVGLSMDFIPTDRSDYIDIDNIDILKELDWDNEIPESDSVEYEDWYADTYHRIYGELEELNRNIESFLREIDKRYGTEYAPTGFTRFRYTEEEQTIVDDAKKNGTRMKAPNDIRFSFKPNSGYTERDNGTSISVRAQEAEEEGTFSAGTFRTKYGVSKAAFDILLMAGVIENSEWHHTGKGYKETEFYSWSDSYHVRGGADTHEYNDAVCEEGSFGDIYAKNKKEIDKLVKEFGTKEWEYSSTKGLWRIPSFEEYAYKFFENEWKDYLTEEERTRLESEHSTISTRGPEIGTAYERRVLHQDLDIKYQRIARERYDSEKHRTLYEERYAKEWDENAEAEQFNANITQHNNATNGKEKILKEILGFFSDKTEDIENKVIAVSSRERAILFHERKEKKREEIKNRYKKLTDEVKERQRKWVDKKLKEGILERVERVQTRPEYFLVEKEEMNGRHGWFDASRKYNLPIFYSGIDFKNKRNYNQYQKYDKEVAEINKKAVEEFNEGIRFRTANDNQDVFVSNAEQAVKGIKQEKATPQQWKAMIQSKGGLKAGEDKWLGLSEWLDEKAKAAEANGSNKANVITKQDVLDFIGENKIWIEEVEYGDANSNAAFASLKEEYDQWLREEGSDYAWEQLTDRYGDDAEIAFWDLGGELAISNKEAATALLGENLINSTRLEYTTEGLENKREIALTVPTIESWNENDDIHFGDAGQGRAVAWARFGETVTYETINDIQEVTEFHEPYEDVNGHDVYKPVGSFKSGDFVVYGKGRDGSMIYVVYINGKQLPVAHATLDDARNAMNEYYKENPRKLRKPLSVLVIDEIQSKRHQEGREQGYAPKKTVTKDMLREARAKENQMRTALEEKYGKPFDGELPVSERAEARRQWVANLSEEDRSAWMNQRELVENYLERLDEQSVGIPDAPFEKNWHELAMKRMLRLAAEEGFDKVAWTKGEQQADRYQLSAVVDHISYFENEDGTLDARAYSPYGGYQPIGKTWEEVERYVGKDIAKKMQEGVSESTENLTWGMGRDGNNIVKEYKTISGDNLKVGGEGMKGFYDKMLPSFMNKYGKKWGVKVGEVELPELEESGRTMWSVDVTPEMKESVMEGQVMFRTKKSFEAGDGYGVTKRTVDNYYESKELVTGEYQTPHQLLEAVRNKHEEYAWKMNDDATEIECLGRWNELLPKKNGRNDKNHSKRIAKKTERAKAMIGDVAKMLGLDVEVLEDTDNLTGKKKTAKGWYDVTTGKITVVLPNHTSSADVMATLLHEGVAHHGLRKMFGEEFDNMLDNVYEMTWAQGKINAIAGENASKERIREATEEYLASLAEDMNFEKATEQKWWRYIKGAFVSMLRKAGVTVNVWLTDNELRYMLWRSYQNLKETSEKRTALETMNDYKMQKKLDVYDGTGRIEPAVGVAEDIRLRFVDGMSARDNGTRFSISSDEKDRIRRETQADDTYMKAPNGRPTRLEETDWLVSKTEGFREWLRPLQERTDISYDRSIVWDSNGDVTRGVVHAYLNRPEMPERPVQRGNESTIAYLRRLTTYEAAMRMYPQDAWTWLRNVDNVLTTVEEPTPDRDTFMNAARERYYRDLAKWKKANGLKPEDTRPLQPVLLTDYDADSTREKPKYDNKTVGEDIRLILGGAEELRQETAAWRKDTAIWATAPQWEDYREEANDEYNIAVSAWNARRHPLSLKNQAWAMAATLAKARHAAARQKRYDRSTVKTIVDYIHSYMRMGYLDKATRGEVSRVLSAVKNVTGARDVSEYINKILNIVTDVQIRNMEAAIDKLASVRALKQNVSGFNVQGKLAVKGQVTLQVFKENREASPEKINAEIDDIIARMSENPELQPMLDPELDGLYLAQQYVKVRVTKQQGQDLSKEKRATQQSHAGSGLQHSERKKVIREMENAIIDSKIAYIREMSLFIGALSDMINDSMSEAKEFREREKLRVENIFSAAMSDLRDVDGSYYNDIAYLEGRKEVNTSLKRAILNSMPMRFLTSSLPTFEQFMRLFGRRAANGEGRLYKHFMRKWQQSVNNEWTGVKEAKSILDQKVEEVFDGKISRWSDLYTIDRKLDNITLVWRDRDSNKPFVISQGQALYLYMISKMSDGLMKLEKMGIDESDILRLSDEIDHRLVILADWLQEKFLPERRVKYNKVHERFFGAPMSAIEDYFPIRILSRARLQEEDVTQQNNSTLPGTGTGALVNRTKNSLPIDIKNANALSVVIEHIEEMEHWAAFCEFNKDLNTLLSFTAFRNKVQNMSTIYGTGEELWQTFKDSASLAAGVYAPKTGMADKFINNISHGIAASKIAWRLYTAIKQILSAPAFIADARIDKFAKNMIDIRGSWQWAEENMPMWRKRWHGRELGDTRLMKDPSLWKLFREGITQKIIYWGMMPNAFVDAVSCAVGARSVYESTYERLVRYGYSPVEARQQALLAAENSFNLTQQSNEGAYITAIQKDRTLAANMMTLFKNNSFAYGRQLVEASRQLARMMSGSYKRLCISYMEGMMIEDGLTEEQASAAARKEYYRTIRRNMIRVGLFSVGLTTLWNLGANAIYLLAGDDDDEKDTMTTDAILKGMLGGPIEGLAGGSAISDLIGILATADGVNTDRLRNYSLLTTPFFSDIQNVARKMSYDVPGGIEDISTLLFSSALGVNPKTLTDAAIAIADYSEGDMETAEEIALLLMRIFQVGTATTDNWYIDELGLNSDEARKMSYDELARRYTVYKARKNNLVASIVGGDARAEKLMKAFDEKVATRIKRLSDEEIEKNWNSSESVKERQLLDKELRSRQGYPARTTSKNKEHERLWIKNKTYGDHVAELKAEDIRRSNKPYNTEYNRRKHEENEASAEAYYQNHKEEIDRYRAVNKTLRKVSELKKSLTGGSEDASTTAKIRELLKAATEQ